MRSLNPLHIVMTFRISLGLLFVLFFTNPCHSREVFNASPDNPVREVDGSVFREGIPVTALNSPGRQDSLPGWRVGLGIHGSRTTTALNDYGAVFSIQYKMKVTY
ncbi:MAG: hypothetical protein GXO82_06520 [Chlorobi bacterium]|nr:hypothetical protein [Chlorobiota bacterium]